MKIITIIRITIIAITTMVIGSNAYAMQRPQTDVSKLTLKDVYSLIEGYSSVMVMSQNTPKKRLEILAEHAKQKIASRTSSTEAAERNVHLKIAELSTLTSSQLTFEVFKRKIQLEVTIESNKQQIATFKKETEQLTRYANALDAATLQFNDHVIASEILQTKPFLVVHFLINIYAGLSKAVQDALVEDQITTVEAVLAKYQTPHAISAAQTDLDHFALEVDLN